MIILTHWGEKIRADLRKQIIINPYFFPINAKISALLE